jgi:mycofactocin precursor
LVITSIADEEHPMEQEPAEPVIEEELLVEEISIDGMCGVY